MAEERNLPLALEFIGTAYKRAAERTGFQTYQIDTQAFRILLLSETKTSSEPVERLPEIIRKLEAMNSMIGEESHRTYAIRVLEAVYPFIERRRTNLTRSDRVTLIFWLSTLSTTLGQLAPEYRALTGSDSTRSQIEAAKGLLL